MHPILRHPWLATLCRFLGTVALAACTLPTEILVPDPSPPAQPSTAASASPASPATPDSPSDVDAGADASAATCAPSSAAGWSPTWVPPTGASQGLCAPQDIANLYAACFGADATDATCSAYESGSPTCASCVLSASTDASWGAVVVFADTTVVNEPGCLDLVDPAEATCAEAAESQTECEHALCDANCPVSDAPSLAAWQECAAEADQGGCGGYGGSCLDAVLGADGGGATCGGADFATAFTNVATVFCGGS
jgi:hypothetical protein